jgi:hypothetical protein
VKNETATEKLSRVVRNRDFSFLAIRNYFIRIVNRHRIFGNFLGGIMVCVLKKVVADLSIDVLKTSIDSRFKNIVSSLSNMKKMSIIDVPQTKQRSI